MRAESLRIGDQTITVLHSKSPRDGGEREEPKPSRRGDDRKPRPGDDKMLPAPRDADAPRSNDANAPKHESNQPPVTPMQTTNEQVRFVLVAGRGEARGLILSGGEQIALPKEVNYANLTFSQDTQVEVEGKLRAAVWEHSFARRAFQSVIRLSVSIVKHEIENRRINKSAESPSKRFSALYF